MSNFSGYKTKAFSESQKFFVLDPNTGSPSFVLGSDLVDQVTPNSNYVYSESTRTTAQAADYAIGSLVQSAGATSAGDNFAATYLVVSSGAGDFPMDNGNELLVIKGDEFLREQLAQDVSTGNGANLVNGATIYAGSVAELEALTPTNGNACYLTLGTRAGNFTFSSADLSSEVSADSFQATHIAPSSDPTGASGAWVRDRNDPKTAELGWYTDTVAYQELSAQLQSAIDNNRRVNLPAEDLYIDATVYVPSDKQIIGRGESYGGTRMRTRTGLTMLKGGSSGSATHTRVNVSGIKPISENITGDPANFLFSFLSGFMDRFENLGFGDIAGVGNQNNALEASGSASWFINLRGITQGEEVGNEDNTGIFLRLVDGTFNVSNIQAETTGKVILENVSGASFKSCHFERSRLILKNSSFNTFIGGYAIDGAMRLDPRSCFNEFIGFGGPNYRAGDAGLFNTFKNSISSLCGHNATDSGLGDSYLGLTATGATWDDVAKKYIAEVSTKHIVIVAAKNTTDNAAASTGIATGTVTVTNETAVVTETVGAYSIPNLAYAISPKSPTFGPCQTLVGFIDATAGDAITVDAPSSAAVFIAPVENVNPQMTDGSAWAVSGAPSLTGESFFNTTSNASPFMDAGVYKLTTNGSDNVSVTQLFKSRTPAKLYAIVLRGRWQEGLAIIGGTSAHIGTRTANIRQSEPVEDENGDKWLVQYVHSDDLADTQGRFQVSFGGYSTALVSQTIEIDFCAVFPVR